MSPADYYFHLMLLDRDQTASLQVNKYSPLRIFERPLFRISGNQGRNWHLASICLPAGTFSVAFVGTVGINYVSDIGISHIVLSGACSALEQDNNATGSSLWLRCSQIKHERFYFPQELVQTSIDVFIIWQRSRRQRQRDTTGNRWRAASLGNHVGGLCHRKDEKEGLID